MTMFYYVFPRYFSFFFFFSFVVVLLLLFFFSSLLRRYPHFYHVYVQERPIHQIIILRSVEFFHCKESHLESQCRLLLHRKSVVNHGFLSIHMWSLAHFHHDILHLNVRHVVVSTRKEEEEEEKKSARTVEGRCICVCVSWCSSRSLSLFTHWRVQNDHRSLLLSVCRFSHWFTFYCIRFLLNITLMDSCLEFFDSYRYFRGWHRSVETTYWVACQIKRRKSN